MRKRLKILRQSFKKFSVKYPAVLIAVMWVLAIIVLRLFVVTAMHMPGSTEINSTITTKLDGAVKSDGVYYLRIAKDGYDMSGAIAVFYPLFPLTVSLVHRLGIGYVAAGQIINFVAIVLASQGLYLLTKEVTKNKRIAILAVLSWLAFPSAHFFVAFYTESMFVAFSVWSLLFLLRKQYLAASILAGLASGTRLMGVVLGIVIMAQYLADKKWKIQNIDAKILFLPISFLGVGLYWAWLYGYTKVLPWEYFPMLYSRSWVYMRFEPNFIKTIWDEIWTYPKLVNSDIWSDIWINAILTKLHFFVSWLAIVWSAYLGWQKKLPKSLVLYSALTALILVLSGNFVSHSRYILPVFPVFILIAMWLDKRSEHMRTLYFVVSATGLGVMLSMFANGYWVG
jgi:Gpi18-like mannosyltransferase